MDRYARAVVFYFSLLSLVPIAAIAGTFDLSELQVTPSPTQACSIQLDGVEKVLDYDVSPARPEVAALVKAKDGDHSLIFWQIGAQEASLAWKPASDFVPRAIAWHPRAQCLFVMGSQGTQYQIIRLDKQAKAWNARTIFTTPNELRRLVPGPSPFIVGRDAERNQIVIAYRLFFGMKNPDGKTFRIVSITEEGKRFYQVIGPAATFTPAREKELAPSRLEATSALPMAFSPSGKMLIWEDGQHNFNPAYYGDSTWVVPDNPQPFVGEAIKGGTITYTPNGLVLLHWQFSSPGIGLFSVTSKNEERQATGMQFTATPSSVADGRGVVGVTKSGQLLSLNYVPIKVPLADVVNAWMFCDSNQYVSLLDKNGGLFETLGNEQLYELYETENYDVTSSTRPYLVTTDIFWELFAVAYEGLFIVKEREQAIPAFWTFVSSANEYYKKSADKSPWRPVFEALSDLLAKNWENPESARIRAAQDWQYSKTLGLEVDYAELKPRGHYASTIKMQDYFKAFRYLTSVYAGKPQFIDELKRLPPEVKNHALAWIGSYQGFISPSRAPLVWKDGGNELPAYARHPNPFPVPFPLSWGFDNEVLLSTVYHQDWPPAAQVTGPAGHRLLPSGLDIAAALGSRFADSLLQGEYEKYPPLRQAIRNLTKLFDSKGKAAQKSENLYDRWITALALQWADDVRPPDGARDEKIWRAKRLQTGLASWATLRHATVLVNERTGAEAGEGGADFELIIMRPPRGYVEPDPRTFGAIADLFETAAKHIGTDMFKERNTKDGQNDGSESERQGIIRRLTETIAKARLFQSMAEKEIRGEILTDDEYEEIRHVGRVAEHHFKIFKSLANTEYALSEPDPMPKIADVAGDPAISPYLMAAVGKPTEWVHVVPFFGRHQLVKGSVYSYYEFESQRLLNDNEWREMVKSQPRPQWVQPFFVNEEPK
jgi:hypothetical protein